MERKSPPLVPQEEEKVQLFPSSLSPDQVRKAAYLNGGDLSIGARDTGDFLFEKEAITVSSFTKDPSIPHCRSSEEGKPLVSPCPSFSEVCMDLKRAFPLAKESNSCVSRSEDHLAAKSMENRDIECDACSKRLTISEEGQEIPREYNEELSPRISTALALTIGELVGSSRLCDFQFPNDDNDEKDLDRSNTSKNSFQSQSSRSSEEENMVLHDENHCEPGTSIMGERLSHVTKATCVVNFYPSSTNASNISTATSTTCITSLPTGSPSPSCEDTTVNAATPPQDIPPLPLLHPSSLVESSESSPFPMHSTPTATTTGPAVQSLSMDRSGTPVKGNPPNHGSSRSSPSPTPRSRLTPRDNVVGGEAAPGLPDTTIHYDPSIPHTEEEVIFVRHCVNSITDIYLCYQCFGTFISPERTPALLLVCGLNMQLYAWDEAFCEDLVRAGFFVIRFDNRDSGLSSKVERGCVKGYLLLLPASLASTLGERIPYTLEDMARDGIALLDALNIPKAHVMGISMGGMISQVMALIAPSRIVTLTSIMSSTNARDLPDAQLQVKLWMLRKPPEPCSLDTLLNFRVHALQKVLPRTLSVDSYYLKRRFLISIKRSRYTNGLIRQACAILRCPPRDDQLRQLHIPALVIHGTQDLIVPPIHGWRTAEVLPHARLLVLKHMGHYFHPAFYETVILAFSAMASASLYYNSPLRVFPTTGVDGDLHADSSESVPSAEHPPAQETDGPSRRRKRGAGPEMHPDSQQARNEVCTPTTILPPLLSSPLTPGSFSDNIKDKSVEATSELEEEERSHGSVCSPVLVISHCSPLPAASLLFPVSMPSALASGDLECIEAISSDNGGGGEEVSQERSGGEGRSGTDGGVTTRAMACANPQDQGIYLSVHAESHESRQKGYICSSEKEGMMEEEKKESEEEEKEGLTLRHSALYPVVVALHSRCGEEVKKSIAVAVPLPHSSNTPEAALMDLHELPSLISTPEYSPEVSSTAHFAQRRLAESGVEERAVCAFATSISRSFSPISPSLLPASTEGAPHKDMAPLNTNVAKEKEEKGGTEQEDGLIGSSTSSLSGLHPLGNNTSSSTGGNGGDTTGPYLTPPAGDGVGKTYPELLQKEISSSGRRSSCSWRDCPNAGSHSVERTNPVPLNAVIADHDKVVHSGRVKGAKEAKDVRVMRNATGSNRCSRGSSGLSEVERGAQSGGGGGSKQFFLFSRADGVKPFRYQDRSVWHTASTSIFSSEGESLSRTDGPSPQEGPRIPTAGGVLTTSAKSSGSEKEIIRTLPKSFNKEEKHQDPCLLLTAPNSASMTKKKSLIPMLADSSGLRGEGNGVAVKGSAEVTDTSENGKASLGSINKMASSARRLFGLLSDFFE